MRGAQARRVELLPSWCDSILYRADDDTIVLCTPEGELEASPEEARALVEALALCLSRSEQASRILDVPSSS